MTGTSGPPGKPGGQQIGRDDYIGDAGDLHIVGEESLHGDNLPGLDHDGEGRHGELVDVARLGAPLW